MDDIRLALSVIICVSFLTEARVSDIVRGCYLTDWSQYRTGIGHFTPDNYIPGLCTHIFYAFADMNEDYTLKAEEAATYEKVIGLKSKQAGLKILLAWGGTVQGLRKGAILETMASSDDNRRMFIKSIVEHLLKYKFDGFNLDWQFPAKRETFALLLKEMKEEFVRHDLLSTMTAHGRLDNVRSMYDVQGIEPHVDLLNLICYDFHRPSDPIIGHISPLYPRFVDKVSIEFAVNQWTKQNFPKKKIVVGLPLYANGWVLSDSWSDERVVKIGAAADGPSPPSPFTNANGTAAYYEICQMALENDVVVDYDIIQHNNYLVMNNTVFYSYEDVRSLRTKMEFIIDNELGGAYVWALDLDDFRGVFSAKPFPLTNIMKELDTTFVEPTFPSTEISTQTVARNGIENQTLNSTTEPTSLATKKRIIKVTEGEEENKSTSKHRIPITESTTPPSSTTSDFITTKVFPIKTSTIRFATTVAATEPIGHTSQHTSDKLPFETSTIRYTTTAPEQKEKTAYESTDSKAKTTPVWRRTLTMKHTGANYKQNRFKCPKNGRFPDPLNCRVFYECEARGTFATKVSCSTGFVFDTESQECHLNEGYVYTC